MVIVVATDSITYEWELVQQFIDWLLLGHTLTQKGSRDHYNSKAE